MQAGLSTLTTCMAEGMVELDWKGYDEPGR